MKKESEKKEFIILFYEELSAVLVMAFGGKKAQPSTIQKIINHLPEFKKYLHRLLKGEG